MDRNEEQNIRKLSNKIYKEIEARQTLVKDSIFHYYVRCILDSELILIDDIYMIRQNYDPAFGFHQDNSTPFPTLVGALSLSATLFTVQKKLNPLIAPITASPMVILAMRRLIGKIHERNQKRNIEELINVFQCIKKLINTSWVYRWLSETDSAFTCEMKELTDKIFKAVISLLFALRVFIRQIGLHVPGLNNFYALIETFKIHKLGSSDNIADYITESETACEICEALFSVFLTCLALSLSPRISRHNIDYDDILKNIVPKVMEISISCSKKIGDALNDLLNLSRITETDEHNEGVSTRSFNNNVNVDE